MNAVADANPDAGASLLFDAAQRSAAYLGEVDNRPVRPSPAAVAGLDRLDMPLPEAPVPRRSR